MRRSMLSAILAGVLGFSAVSIGCGGRSSPAGFRLPETGDSDRGKQAFVALECYSCHTVDGTDLPAARGDVPQVVKLGGLVHELRTDGYLVASIIHPSHRLAPYPSERISVEGESRMPDYANTMTIRQMVDLVAFLQEHYRFEPIPTAY